MKLITIDRSKAVEQDTSPSGHFTGKVYIQRLATSPADGDLEIAAVYFDAGSRNKPHVHEHTQVLEIVEGVGIVATETERRVVKAGDVISIPANTWHWHGATRDSAMMHLSIRLPDAGGHAWSVDMKDWATSY